MVTRAALFIAALLFFFPIYDSDASAAQVDTLISEIQSLKKQISKKESELFQEGADKKALKEEISGLQQAIKEKTKSAHEQIAKLDEQGADTTKLEAQLIAATGQVSKDILNPSVALSLLESALATAETWIMQEGPNVLIKIFVFITLLLIFWFLSRIAKRIVRKIVRASQLQVSELLDRFVVNTVGNLVFVFGILIALSQVGIHVGPLLAGLGVAGFIVGFALKDTLGNFASGIMILWYRPYDSGDFIEAAGVTGKVDDMNLVSTKVLTPDNQILIIPNSSIWGNVIRNVTHQQQRRIDLVFGIGYEDNIEHADHVLHDIVESHEKILKDPQPTIKVNTLNESSVDFIVRPWVKSGDYWDVYWDLTRAVKERFDAEGISIPFPQRDVHLYHATATAAASTTAPNFKHSDTHPPDPAIPDTDDNGDDGD